MIEIWEKYPEVFHYTSVQGLQGILGSQTLFATHYVYLNDKSELRLLREALPGFVEPTITKIVLDKIRQNSTAKRDIQSQRSAQKISKKIATEFATIHFDAAFAPIEDRPASVIPYITSF